MRGYTMNQMALTRRQRKSIIERDNGTSIMQHYSEEEGWHNGGYCEEWQECTNLQVHHLVPQRMLYDMIPKPTREQVDDPLNLGTLFSCEHIGCCPDGKPIPENAFVLHPDNEIARQLYATLGNEAYDQMMAHRDELLAQGEPYWNPDHDAEMLQTAAENTILAESQGWSFPGVQGRVPEKPYHWSDEFFLPELEIDWDEYEP